MTPDEAESLVALFFPKLNPRSPLSDKEIAGLSPDSHPELLTWERVYKLALVQHRVGPARSPEVLDTKGFAELAARHAFTDFSRFRTDFLAGRTGARRLPRPKRRLSRSPAPSSSHRQCAHGYRATGELSGALPTIDPGRGLRLECARRGPGRSVGARAKDRLADEIAHFRDRLDATKAALGLEPRTLLIPDRQSIAAFGEVFESIHNWHRNQKRTLDGLSRLVARLPALGEVVIEGQSILGAIETNPSRMEEFLAKATRVVNQNRARTDKDGAAQGTDVQLELRTGQRVRRLVETRRAYESDKRRYELANRAIEEFIMQLVAPPGGGTSALAQSTRAMLGTQSLLDQSVQIHRAEDRLVGLWAAFNGERLALYRELGVLPYDDWKSFYDDLAARPGPAK